MDSDWLVDGIGAGMRELLSRTPSPTSVIDSKERQYGSAFDCETALKYTFEPPTQSRMSHLRLRNTVDDSPNI